MIYVESRYKQNAVSNKGAIGLMQVMPLTRARFGYTDLSNAPDNLRAGAAYLKWLLIISITTWCCPSPPTTPEKAR
jgi:lysozyme